MQRWRTALAGLILSVGLIAYLIGAVWLLERIPQASIWRWIVLLGLSLAWIWPALKLSRWTLRDPGSTIDDLR